MRVGVYVLAVNATDNQSPHDDDEVYYVVRGRGTLRRGATDEVVGPGDVRFVAAHEPHRFHDIREELVLLVVFASRPASRDAGASR